MKMFSLGAFLEVVEEQSIPAAEKTRLHKDFLDLRQGSLSAWVFVFGLRPEFLEKMFTISKALCGIG